MNPLRDAARSVGDHARSIVQLELRLAATELKRKAAAFGIGIGLMLAAAVLLLLGLLFGLAAATAGIAQVWPVWLSLLVMFGGLLLVAAVLGSVGVRLLRRGAKPVPEQAIAEARLTKEALLDEQGA